MLSKVPAAPSRSAAPGFTLVELLVVISIVALLLSILIPAMSEARAAAKRSVCASQLRQWSVAHNVYMHDSNGAMIYRRAAGEGSATSHRYGDTIHSSMADVFKEYIGDDRLLTCPDSWHLPGRFSHTVSSNRWRLGYAYMGYLIPLSQPSPQATKIDHIYESDVQNGGARRPLILMADVSEYSSTGLFPVGYKANHPNRGDSLSETGRPPGTGVNVLYMAGHCQWIAASSIDRTRLIQTYNAKEYYWAQQ